MKFSERMLRLYAVTDRSWLGAHTLAGQVEAALRGGATCVQLREKELDPEAFLEEARELKGLCARYGVPLIINDNVALALEVGADGVHVGQEDMAAGEVRRRVGEKLIVGVSAHTVEEAVEAEKNGADYLGLGAVFTTSTKTNVVNMSPRTLRAICDAVRIPTVAIGGIREENLPLLRGSGVDGVAVVSAIFGAEDPGKAAARLRQLSEELVKSNG